MRQRRYIKELNRKRARKKFSGTPVIMEKKSQEVPKSYLDSIEEEPVRGALRIYFQNVNTLKIGSEAAEDIRAVKKLTAVGTSVICLTKINKNMEDGETRSEVEKVFNKAKPGMTLHAQDRE